MRKTPATAATTVTCVTGRDEGREEKPPIATNRTLASSETGKLAQIEAPTVLLSLVTASHDAPLYRLMPVEEETLGFAMQTLAEPPVSPETLAS